MIIMEHDTAVALYSDLAGNIRMSPEQMAEAAASVAQAIGKPAEENKHDAG